MDNLFYQLSWLMLELEGCTLTENLETSVELVTQLGEIVACLVDYVLG